MPPIFKSLKSFYECYLFYLQLVIFSLTIMFLVCVERTYTPYLLWLNVPLGIYGFYLQLKINLRLRRTKTLIRFNVMEAVDEHPELTLKQILRRLSIQYPLVPYAFFKEAADEAIANQYMGVAPSK